MFRVEYRALYSLIGVRIARDSIVGREMTCNNVLLAYVSSESQRDVRGIREWTVWPPLESRQGTSHDTGIQGTAYRPLTRVVQRGL